MPAFTFRPDSTGVLPLDLLRVLRADGFLPEVLPVNRRSFDEICSQLDQGHPTIALQGGAGWIPHLNVIGGHSNVYLHIMDSNSAATGWWRIPKEEALGHYKMFLSVNGYDGQNCKTSLLSKMKAVLSLVNAWKLFF